MRPTFELQDCLSVDKIFSAFHYQGPWNYTFVGEQHDFWELVYVNKGQLLITANDKRFVLKAGELVIHEPNEFHALSAYDKGMPDYIVISFSASDTCLDILRNGLFSLNEEQQFCLQKVIEYSKKSLGELTTPYLSLGDIQAQYDTPETRQLLKNWLEVLLLSLVEENASIDVLSRNINQTQNRASEDVAKQIVDYVRMHIEEQITISEISMALNFSIAYLEKIFRKKMGSSILKYINTQKMLRARQLLQTGKYSVKEVSLSVGFGTQQYFSRRFKKEYGMTPTEFMESERVKNGREKEHYGSIDL